MLWWIAEIIFSHGHIFLTGNLPKWVSFWMFLRDFGGMGRMGGRGVAQCALVNTGVGEAVGFWERKTRILEF